MNKEIYNERFEYYYNENSGIDYNKFRENDIKNTKFIFDQLKEYYSNLKIKDDYHANELYESTYDNYIYVFGGVVLEQPLRTCERYCITTNTWEMLPTLQDWIGCAVACIYYDMIYICGGWDGRKPSNECLQFDIIHQTFSRISSLQHKRALHAACVIDCW